jgi:hypothetical protein
MKTHYHKATRRAELAAAAFDHSMRYITDPPEISHRAALFVRRMSRRARWLSSRLFEPATCMKTLWT